MNRSKRTKHPVCRKSGRNHGGGVRRHLADIESIWSRSRRRSRGVRINTAEASGGWERVGAALESLGAP